MGVSEGEVVLGGEASGEKSPRGWKASSPETLVTRTIKGWNLPYEIESGLLATSITSCVLALREGTYLTKYPTIRIPHIRHVKTHVTCMHAYQECRPKQDCSVSI